MKKYLNFIGSLLLAGYIVPMYFFVLNYPQFAVKDTFLVIALFIGIALGTSSILWLFFRDINKVSFFYIRYRNRFLV